MEEHLLVLQNAEFNHQGAIGRNIFKFGNQIQNIEAISENLNQKFSRADVANFIADDQNSDLASVVAILAWGIMRYDHGKTFFKNWNHVSELICRLRAGELTRSESFDAFQNLRNNGLLSGIGIAYFTKIICFLNPEANGYILDQWTGKSVNLIWGDNLVDISNLGWVTDFNSANVYEEFCQRIEFLGQYLQVAPLEAEERIFSVGGRNPGVWRQYVKNSF